jgi:hypothetical protein
MNNYKYSEVKRLIDYGAEVKDLFGKLQPSGETFGYYTPSNANWSYQFKVCKLNGKLYEVVTQFGAVLGGRELFLLDNTK